MRGSILSVGLVLFAQVTLAGEFTKLTTDLSALPAQQAWIGSLVTSRAAERTTFSDRGPTFSISFVLDPKISGERSQICVKGPRAEIRAGRVRGLVFGAGALLRSMNWRSDSFTVAEGERTFEPKKPLRCAYYARHFYNWYHTASADELIHLTEDLELSGVNTIRFQFFFPSIDVIRSKEGDVQSFEQASRRLTDALERMDMDLVCLGGGNQAPDTAPAELRAAPQTDGKRGNGGFNVCPAKPGGFEYLTNLQQIALAKYEGVKINWFSHWPYDEGGCTCEKCRPWGGNGYLRLVKELAKQNRVQHPQARVLLGTWTFYDDEFELLYKYLATEDSKWIDALIVDAHGDFPKYVLNHKLPREVQIVTFPEISMWGRAPWSGFGGIAMPARFERIFRQCERVATGFICYSEGIYEDLNKFVVTQLYVDPSRHWQDIVREYCHWEFPGMDEIRFVELITLLEETQVLPDFKQKSSLDQLTVGHDETPVNGDFLEYCRECHAKATKAEALSAELEKALTPACRASWRWRQLRLRTIVDKEIFGARTLHTPVADEVYRELIKLYHAERTCPWVRSPLK